MPVPVLRCQQDRGPAGRQDMAVPSRLDTNPAISTAFFGCETGAKQQNSIQNQPKRVVTRFALNLQNNI